MYYFEIKDREAAHALVRSFHEHRQLPARPFAAYLFFLATALDGDRLAKLYEVLPGLDSLTGPYIAGLVFVNRVSVDLRNLREPKVDSVPVSPGRLSYFLAKGECDQNDLWDPAFPLVERDRKAGRSDLDARIVEEDHSRANDRVAEALGVTERLPCVVVIDHAHEGEIEVLEIPDDLDRLVRALRSIVSRLTSPSDHQLAMGLIEKIHDAAAKEEDAQGLLHRHANAIRTLEESRGDIVKKVASNLQLSRRVVETALSPQRVALFREASRSVEGGAACQRLLEELGVSSAHGDDPAGRHAMRSAAHHVVESICPADSIRQRMQAAQATARQLRGELLEAGVPSVCAVAREVAREHRLNIVKARLRLVAQELATPSFLLKLAGLLA